MDAHLQIAHHCEITNRYGQSLIFIENEIYFIDENDNTQANFTVDFCPMCGTPCSHEEI